MADARLSELRALRRRAAYLIARNGHDVRLRPALIGLERRAASLERCLDLERRLVRMEAEAEASEGDDRAGRTGEVRAERARLAARIAAERRALDQVERVFAIRRAALA